jgi:hypothetical protein
MRCGACIGDVGPLIPSKDSYKYHKPYLIGGFKVIYL